MSSLLKCAFYSVLGFVVLGQGWTDDARGAAQRKPEPVEADGTVEAFAPGKILILTNTNQKWLFTLSRNTELHVTGSAEFDYLRPRLFIEFEADLDRRGRSPNPVGELSLFTPSQVKFPGVFPAGMGGPDAAAAMPAPAPKKPDPNATTRYKILGQITAIKNRSLTVNAARGIVRIDVAEDAKIGVDVADLSVVQKGDKINVVGTSRQEGFGDARTVAIELSQPLSAPKKKGPRRPKRPGRKPRIRPGAKPEPAEKAEAAEEPGGEKPVAKKEDRVTRIVKFLQLPPGSAQAKQAMKIALGDGEAEVFTPSKPIPIKGIAALLGKPEKTTRVEGMMPPPDGGEPQHTTLKLLDCQGIKVFVDEQGVVRFYKVDDAP